MNYKELNGESIRDGFNRNTQPELPFTGTQLRDAGMKLASESAEQDSWGWNEAAYNFLTGFVNARQGSFMAEEIRNASAGLIPEPPSKRAWGGIMMRAAKAGLIRKVGYGQVSNPRAHKCFATVWIKK